MVRGEKKMKYQNVVVYGSLVAGLVGCENLQKAPEPPRYFTTVEMGSETGMALTSGDFDGDGDLDFIVGARPAVEYGHLYLFLNDGKGNFTIKEPERK